MREIHLSAFRRCRHTGRHIALVDDIDYEWAGELNWSADCSKRATLLVYAVRRIRRSNGTTSKSYMHREIFARAYGAIPDGIGIDHRDNGIVSGLDNRRANLRLADETLNLANARRRGDNTSGYRGVSWSRHLGRWEAYIDFHRRRTRLGAFDSVEDAAAAYDAAAIRIFGEYARLNLKRLT